jgi:hypothetical protein
MHHVNIPLLKGSVRLQCLPGVSFCSNGVLVSWFSVLTVFVKSLRAIAIVGVAALRALIPLNLNGDLVEAILGDEDGKESIRSVAVFPDRGFATVGTGPRVSDPLALKPAKPRLKRIS